MEPFRKLLSSKEDFYWDQNLKNAFTIAKNMIAENVKYGVKTYIPGKPTALISDWSKTGIGFILAQKKCQCKGLVIDCCQSGWSIICIGSRFLTQAENNYSAIEGELLGVTWALGRTKFWSLGNDQLTIFTDHKPLIGLLLNKDFDSIHNPRLARMVEKTMRWRFHVCHIPGLKN